MIDCSTKYFLLRYIDLRHQCEMWGLDEQGTMMEELVWDMLHLPGKPQDPNAIDTLNELCDTQGIPPYRDIREK